MTLRADLLADSGAAASSPDDFFRSPEFLAGEAATHSLLVGAEPLVAAPLIVRPIEGTELRDAISPYGYPGSSAHPPLPPDPAAVDWSGTGLVAVFLRDRIGGRPALAGATRRWDVWIADPARPTGVRKRLREQVRRNLRRGWEIRAIRGADAGDGERAAFERAYAETMTRAGASERYRMGSDYFARVLGAPSAWLLLAQRGDHPPAAGAIAVSSDGFLHYFLGGTADEALAESPMKNLFVEMIELAAELGMPLNLGGGVRPGDPLDEFKRGFANASEPFRTHELICDRAAYGRLCARAGTAPGEFFPAYRAVS